MSVDELKKKANCKSNSQELFRVRFSAVNSIRLGKYTLSGIRRNHFLKQNFWSARISLHLVLNIGSSDLFVFWNYTQNRLRWRHPRILYHDRYYWLDLTLLPRAICLHSNPSLTASLKKNDFEYQSVKRKFCDTPIIYQTYNISTMQIALAYPTQVTLQIKTWSKDEDRDKLMTWYVFYEQIVNDCNVRGDYGSLRKRGWFIELFL